VDGLEAVVDSLKSDDATITENSVDRVFYYKIGSLSNGKDVYARVKAWGIGGGGYSLSVYLYLQDRRDSTIQALGGTSLRRWGMPYNTNPTNPQDGLYYARLYEDVQTFIKALRVYEFKDRYVAFFAADAPTPSGRKHTHIFNTYVFPKAKKGEEGWFGPYLIKWEVQGAPEAIHDVQLGFAVNNEKDKFFYILGVGVGDKGEKGYANIGFVDQKNKKIYYAKALYDIDWRLGNVELISI